MAMGAGLGGLIPVAMTVFGLIAMFGRKRKPTEPTEADKEFDARQAAKAEMERRMAAYLASRAPGAEDSVVRDLNNKENEK